MRLRLEFSALVNEAIRHIDAMTDTTAQFKAQLPRNLVLQMLSFASHIAVGIVLTPYLIRNLGPAAFGLIPIAGVMTQYVSIITHSVSSATGRFLTIALQRKDSQNANRVFNTAFFSYVALGLVQIPVFALIIYYANIILTIPEDLYWDAIALLVCGAVTFLIGLIAGVFGVPIYANNRLDISRTLDIAAEFGRIAGIVILFVVFGPALRYVGYVGLFIGISRTVVTALIGKRLEPALNLDLHAYDWSQLRQIMGMGGWLLVNYMGFLLFLKIDIWICNRFISAEAAGEYAAVLQWSSLIRQSGLILAGVTAPMVMIYYARSELDQMIRLAQISVRLLCLCLAIPIAILCVFSSSILTLWLGDSFAHLAPLMVLMLCHLTINVGILPLFAVRRALNKVKVPALMSIAMGSVNLLLALLFVTYLDWGVYGVALAGALTLTFLNALWNPVYTATILRQPWHAFLRAPVSGVFLLLFLIIQGMGMRHFFFADSWPQLITASILMALTGLAAAWIILPSGDRRVILQLLPRKFTHASAALDKTWT